MSGEYNNKLEEWYGQCPAPVQTVLEWPYTQFNDALHWITGEPQKLVGQCQTFLDQGEKIKQISTQIGQIESGLTHWTGDARNAFTAKMETLTGNFDQLGVAVSATNDILVAAAETCVEAANFIIDIVKMIIEFLLTTLAIKLALAAFTVGASILAWIVENIANGLMAVARMVQGLTKVAQVLQKIASALTKVAQILRKIAEILKVLKEIFELLQELKKGASLGAKAILTIASLPISLPTNAAANAVINGVNGALGSDVIPNMPGGGGEGRNAVQDGAGAITSSNDAVDIANNNRPPGH